MWALHGSVGGSTSKVCTTSAPLDLPFPLAAELPGLPGAAETAVFACFPERGPSSAPALRASTACRLGGCERLPSSEEPAKIPGISAAISGADLLAVGVSRQRLPGAIVMVV